jgi:hypothetical protein
LRELRLSLLLAFKTYPIVKYNFTERKEMDEELITNETGEPLILVGTDPVVKAAAYVILIGAGYKLADVVVKYVQAYKEERRIAENEKARQKAWRDKQANKA